MPNLVQIIYISRSTFTPSGVSMGIEPNVARILAASRINNRKNGLVGVLYFGDGCFFQCLEGEAEAVDALYAKLLRDNRHQDLKLFSRKTITTLSFPDWSMKYVPLEKQMNRLLAMRGLKTFDPYQFDADMIKSVMELLHASADAGSVYEAEVAMRKSEQLYASEKSGRRWKTVAIIAAVLAAGSAVFALTR
jgi:hypothetical protein